MQEDSEEDGYYNLLDKLESISVKPFSKEQTALKLRGQTQKVETDQEITIKKEIADLILPDYCKIEQN